MRIMREILTFLEMTMKEGSFDERFTRQFLNFMTFRERVTDKRAMINPQKKKRVD